MAIVLGCAVVVVALAGFLLYRLVSGIVGPAGLTAAAGGGCSIVKSGDVDTILGGHYELVELGGIAGVAGPLLDGRVLTDAPVSCWASDPEGHLARIARYEGADAATRFAAERTRAMGTTEDRGNGLSVSSAGYLNKTVTAGDEAFCTSGDPLGFAGVLERRGSVLVYVSTTAAGQGAGSAPDFQLPADGSSPTAGITLGTDDANCDLAIRLAATVS